MKAKKGQEGYVLLYVVVVIILLSVVAMTISTISLRNLQRQQASLERTQQLYAAEGEIERFVANVKSQALEVTAEESEKTEKIKTEFWDKVSALGGSMVGGCGWSENEGKYYCIVPVTAVNGAVAVFAKIEFRLTIMEESAGQYKITVAAASYRSYTINGDGGAGGA